jgi:hypothetical protein
MSWLRTRSESSFIAVGSRQPFGSEIEPPGGIAHPVGLQHPKWPGGEPDYGGRYSPAQDGPVVLSLGVTEKGGAKTSDRSRPVGHLRQHRQVRAEVGEIVYPEAWAGSVDVEETGDPTPVYQQLGLV